MSREVTQRLAPKPEWQRLKESPVLSIGGDLAMAIDIDSAGVGWVRTEVERTVRYVVAE